MTTPASLDLIKTFIQSEDTDVKANCFKYLKNLLIRTFDKHSDLIPDWKVIMNPVMPKEMTDADKEELKDAMRSSQSQLFEFLQTIVIEVISFDLRLI